MRSIESPVLAEFGPGTCSRSCFVLPGKSLGVRVPLTSLFHASAVGRWGAAPHSLALPVIPRVRGEDALRLLPREVTVPSFRVLDASVPLLKQWECSATSKDLHSAAASRPQVPVPVSRTLFALPRRGLELGK